MNEDAARTAWQAFDQRRCVFDKVILARMGVCPHAYKFNLAEREGVQCQSAPARALCAAFHAALLDKARFALRLTQPPQPLTHAQAMRLATGGLLGLRAALEDGQYRDDGPATVADIHGLIRHAIERCGGLEHLPYAAIVRTIARFQPRPRHIRRRTE